MAKKRDFFLEELIIDLKAAVSIGDIESIANALEYALEIPEIASNQRLSESDIDNIILPLGSILAVSSVDETLLKALTEDRLTGIRAISGVAQTIRYFEKQNPSMEAVNKAVKDYREEVGLAVTKIIEMYPEQVEKTEDLIMSWRELAKEREWVAAMNVAHLLENLSLREDLLDEVFQINLPQANKSLVNALHKIKVLGKEYPEAQIIRWKNVENVNPWVVEQLTKE